MKFIKVLLFAVSVLGVVQVHAQSSAELKRRKEKLNSELADLNREYEETRKNKKATIKQLNILKAQIALREEKITTVNSEIRQLNGQINENTNTVHTLQGQLDQLKKEYAAMVVFAYHNQSAYNKMMFVFAGKDFNQAYKRLKYLQQFGTYRERQAASIQGTQKELHVKINQLDRTKNEKSNLLEEQQKERETLGKERNTQTAVVNDLSKQEGTLKKQQRTLMAQRRQIDRQIQNAIAREVEAARRKAEAEARAEAARRAALAAEKARAENKSAAEIAEAAKPKPITRSTATEALTATPEAAKLNNDFMGNRGLLPWPVATGQIIQDFGPYVSDGIRNDNHGIDIRTSSGAAARAVFEGTVISVNDISGSYMVLLRHGSYITAYANLRSVSVSAGQKVNTRQTLGSVATDPFTGETVIHFELNKAGAIVNPKTWLASQ
ncbi:murein hydrolase activator EnvC family protein [Mucilaginibacter aquatilis]|uniref:Peptidoglycan DD-metalloendopeptidase family protein n=1 Tax=Mucilaginibacter aquatilis TaxID=1517760 RepID=A0A6I4IB11_9SPHI|nr:peptidoglycan DD-metalloendopeptidase family protein [Mucilaginibacter aquatilis]MVN92385.1 peptidoglycan DD-metalloendopeptidase family protein [Mucilaginibacter aquatilis]